VRARTHARTRGCFNRASVYLETAKTRAKLLFDGNDPIHGAFSSRASYKTRGERYVLAKYAADLTSSSDVVGPPCARVWYVEKEGDRERERERERESAYGTNYRGGLRGGVLFTNPSIYHDPRERSVRCFSRMRSTLSSLLSPPPRFPFPFLFSLFFSWLRAESNLVVPYLVCVPT